MLNQYNGTAAVQDGPVNPVLNNIQGQLQLLTDRLSKLDSQASGVADRVFGSQSSIAGAGLGQIKAPATAKLEQIRSEIDSAHSWLSSLESSFGRFAQL